MDLTDLIGDDEQLPKALRKQARTASTSFLPGRDEVGDDIHWGSTGGIDHVLQGRTIDGAENSILRALTDQAREANALPLPVAAGTRVTLARNVGALLAYGDLPEPGVGGTVITVRSANGDITASDHGVHVLWDDGQFRPIRAEYLRAAGVNQKRAKTVRVSFIEFAELGGMYEQLKVGSNDLVHKATKDLWAFKQDGDNFVIERLFDEDGSPLKV